MDISELRQKSKEELTSLLRDLRARIDEMRFLSHEKKLKNVREFSNVRKDIARILMLLDS